LRTADEKSISYIDLWHPRWLEWLFKIT